MSSVRLGDAQNNLPGNVEMCIADYYGCYMTSGLVTVCRDAEVLSLFAAIINKLKDRMQKEVPKIFEAVFQVTLQMITKDFSVSDPSLWVHHLNKQGIQALQEVYAPNTLVGGYLVLS